MSTLNPHLTAVKTPLPQQFTTLTIVALVLTLLCLSWSFVDPRLVEGVAVWAKPLKFAISFVILFGTLALLERRLSLDVQAGWPLRITGWIMAASFLSEMAYMMYQAGRAEASHFNMSTPFTEFMYTVVMATGAVALVACTAVIGWVAKNDASARLTPAMRDAVWIGFLLTFGLTMIVAGYMSSGASHHVGLHTQGAPTLPVFGWSGVTGDLRPAHFLALHAMQALPLVALACRRMTPVHASRTLRIAALIYSGVTLAVFIQALLGLPLIRLA